MKDPNVFRAHSNPWPLQEPEVLISPISTLCHKIYPAVRSKQSPPLPKTPPFLSQNSRKRKELSPQQSQYASSIVKRALFQLPFPDPLDMGYRFKVVDSDTFDTIFDPDADITDVETDRYICLQGEQNQPFLTQGVASCLAVGIKGLDLYGEMSFRIIGHFSAVNIKRFIDQEEDNLIKGLLDDTFASSPTSKVFLAGMYDSEQFEAVKQRIEMDYHPNKITSFPNPWKVPGERLRLPHYDEDLEEYLLHKNTALTLGMTPEGEIFVKDANPDSSFMQFSEEEFEKWKIERQVSKAAAKKTKLEMPALHQQESTSIKIIKRKEFKQRFHSKVVPDIDTDEWELVPQDKKHSLMTTGVATCLAIAVRCFDLEGQLISCGLGHFGNPEDAGYIQDFLDQVASNCTSMEIFAAGMYFEENYKVVQELFEEYNPTKIEAIINPWKIPKDAFERADSQLLDDYVDGLGGSLRMGITASGEIYVADEPCQPSAPSDFFQFNEQAFEEWKQKRLEGSEEKKE